MSVHLVSRRSLETAEEKYFGGIGSMNTLSAINGSLNHLVDFKRHITLKDKAGSKPPDLLPETIEKAIIEANICLANECWNAASAMYRLAVDLCTKSLVPEGSTVPNRTMRSLGLRMNWLFENELLSNDLKDLAECVQQDGNDGSHDGSLNRIDAEDLKDFCYALVARVYTEPQKLELAKQRRANRRNE